MLLRSKVFLLFGEKGEPSSVWSMLALPELPASRRKKSVRELICGW